MNFLVRVVAGAALLLASQSVFAEKVAYQLDTTHSEVGFNVKHLMIANVKGRFPKFEGTFQFDDAKGELSDLDVKIEAASVNTNEAKRDEHLQSPDFFDTKNNPNITFKSEKVESKKGKPSKVHGTLTMRGVAKKVALDVDYKGMVKDAWGNDKVVFVATTKINRKDFGVSWNKALDKGGVAVSDEVTITIDGQAQKVAKK